MNTWAIVVHEKQTGVKAVFRSAWLVSSDPKFVKFFSCGRYWLFPLDELVCRTVDIPFSVLSAQASEEIDRGNQELQEQAMFLKHFLGC